MHHVPQFSRLIAWFLLGVLCIGRLDLCLLPSPSGVQSYDGGWHCYVALAMQDHQYNNPVSVVWFQIMLHALGSSRRLRARRKLRVNLRLLARAVRSHDLKATTSVAGGMVGVTSSVVGATIDVSSAVVGATFAGLFYFKL